MADSVLTVVGGRMVLSKVSSPQSSHSPYPLTGQQLMMQLDQVTSRMGELTTQSMMDLTTQSRMDLTTQSMMDLTTQSRMDLTTQQSRDTHMDTQDEQQQQQIKSQAGSMNSSYNPNTSSQKCIMW